MERKSGLFKQKNWRRWLWGGHIPGEVIEWPLSRCGGRVVQKEEKAMLLYGKGNGLFCSTNWQNAFEAPVNLWGAGFGLQGGESSEVYKVRGQDQIM